MRTLLNYVKGPTCYEDIRTVDGFVHPTFRDTCYAMGSLDDDKEYVDAIIEASSWESGYYLRKLFTTLLFANQMTIPEFVWEHTWQYLTDDILHRQRNFLQCQGIHLVCLFHNIFGPSNIFLNT